MTIPIGTLVEHIDFGPGEVRGVLGTIAMVNFFGEDIDCDVNELKIKKSFSPNVSSSNESSSRDKVAFRKGFEAVNLGVVPPGSASLIKMSIGGDQVVSGVKASLKNAKNHGLCKVVFGNYGTGKSHYLHLVNAIAQQSGWVVSYLEFDPKAVDPAKPHLVYREIMARLKFPEREDGTATLGFRGLVKEIRKNWQSVRDLPYLKKNRWFRNGLGTLQFYPHNDNPDYVSACDWLAGQPVSITGPGSIRALARGTNINPRAIPNMPKVRETGEIYAFHLVVVNEICKALGYKGLLVILDEAEHVRGYSVPRKKRANNFFELLARSAHLPLGEGSPVLNDHDFEFPEFWNYGPHFGLFVGLTEGNTFEDESLSLRDACVFLHSEEDKIILKPPTRDEYEKWCLNLLTDFHEHYPEKTELISFKEARMKVAEVLGDEFEMHQDYELVIRIWVKLACLVPSVILAREVESVNDIVSIVQKAVGELTGGFLPWE